MSFQDNIAQWAQSQYDQQNDFGAASVGATGGTQSVTPNIGTPFGGHYTTQAERAELNARVRSPFTTEVPPIQTPFAKPPTIPTIPTTPIADAMKEANATNPLLGVGSALLKDIGGAINQFGAKTQGTEVAAAPVSQALSGVPGLGLGILGLSALSPDLASAFQTPLRDVPVLGGVVRGAETAANVAQATGREIAQPLRGLAALGGTPETPAQLGSHAYLAQQRTENPPVDLNKLGTTPQEVNDLTGKFLSGTATLDETKRFETLTHNAAEAYSEASPIGAMVLDTVFDPLTYLDAGGVFAHIGKLQALQKTWAATADVTRMGEALEKAPLIERLIASTIAKPITAKEGELLTKEALKMATPKASNLARRIVQPFDLTPTAKVVDALTRATDNLGVILADGSRSLGDKVKLLDAMQQAARSGNLDALKPFFGEKIVNSTDFQRAIHGALDFKPQRAIEEYKQAQAAVEQLSQTLSTVNPAYNEAAAGFIQSTGEELGRGYKNIFDNVIEQWKSGKIDLNELNQQVENVAGARLLQEYTDHAAEVMSKTAGIPKPNVITRITNLMKQYEGFLYVGSNPSTIVNNIINTVASGMKYGVNPMTTARELGNFYARIGYKPPENLGKLVGKALEQQVGEAGAFGAQLPEWTRKVPGIKQLGQVWQASEGRSRAQAWATGFERFMGSNFKYGDVIPNLPEAVANHIRTTQGENGLRRVIHGLENARNYGEADNLLVGGARSWASYRDEIAVDLSKQFSEMAGRDIQITGEMVQDALPADMRERVVRIMQDAWERTKGGVDFPTAYNDARYAEANAAAKNMPDLFESPADEWAAANKAERARMRMGEKNVVAPAYEQPSPTKMQPPSPKPPPEEPLGGVVKPAEPPTKPSAPSAAAPVQEAGTLPLPDELRGQAIAAEWADMTDAQREFAIGLQRAKQEALTVAPNEPLPTIADVYQGAGDVPTAMADVTNVPPVRAEPPLTLGDVSKAAQTKGIATATAEGKPLNKFLMNALNKHAEENGVAKFASMADVQQRAADALKILDNYAPSSAPKAVKDAVEEVKSYIQTPETWDNLIEELKRIGIDINGESPFGLSDLPNPKLPPSAPTQSVVASEIESIKQQLKRPIDARAAPKDIKYAKEERARLKERLKELESQKVSNAAESTLRTPDPYAQHTAIGRLRQAFNTAQQEGAPSVLNHANNTAWNDALGEAILDTLGKAISDEAQTAAGVMPKEVMNLARQYLKRDYMPALNTAKQGANAMGRTFVEHTVLNYDGRYNIDDGLSLVAPFSFWWLHTLGNYTREFIDHPALLAFYIRLKKTIDAQSEGMPERFKGRIKLPFPLSKDLGDGIWVDALRALMPAEDVFQINQMERASYNTVKEDGTTDYHSVFQDLFGIHTPYKLAMALLQGRPEDIQQIVASLPPARLLRGVTSLVTPGGVGLESKYDKFYYERAIKELVAEGKLTADEAKIALLQQSGQAWDMVKQRAGLENYGVRELTGAVGMRGYVMTAGEQKYLQARKDRDALWLAAVRQYGGNPNMPPEQQYQFLSGKGFFKSPEYQQFSEAHPELEAASFAHTGYGKPEAQQQEARYRDYLVSQIWDAYKGAPKLRKQLISADLGDTFKQTFLSKERNYDNIPTSALLGWANAIGAKLTNVAGMETQTPDPYKVRFTTDEQNARYQSFYDEVQQGIGWNKVHELEQQYFALADKQQRAAFLKQNPALKVEWDAEAQFYADNPDLLKIMEQAGLKKIPTTGGVPTQGQALNQAMQAVGLNWDTVNAMKEEYNKLAKGTGARTAYLKTHPDLLRYFQLSGALYKEDSELNQSGGTGQRKFYLNLQRPYQPRNRTGRNFSRTPSIYIDYRTIESLSKYYPKRGQGRNNYTRRVPQMGTQ